MYDVTQNFHHAFINLFDLIMKVDDDTLRRALLTNLNDMCNAYRTAQSLRSLD